ncbi:hypothetical protein GCM10020331_041060 [Ectobacillus funiculus]
MRNAMGQVEGITDIDTSLKEQYDTIANSYYLLEEAAYALREKLDMMEYDPQRLDYIETRLNEIRTLKKRSTDIRWRRFLEYAAAIEEEISKIENKDVHIEQTKKQLKELEAAAVKEAMTLSAMRQELAVRLTAAIHQELKELYMDKTKFEIIIGKTGGLIR